MATEVPPPDRRRWTVGDDADARLDRYLAAVLGTSRAQAARWIEEGWVRLDGRPARKADRPTPGQVVEVAIPPPTPVDLEPEPLPLQVLYEDEDVAVIDKPPGLVVHPAPGHWRGTLAHALAHRFGVQSPAGRPGIVHRLDKDTSGLLVVAKHEAAHRALAEALKARAVRRVYLAAAWGHLEPSERTVDLPIGRHPRLRQRMTVRPDGRPARTHLRVLERWPAADLLRVTLETGRTHQIRVHLRALGHPVVGDALYGPGWERGLGGPHRPWALELARRTPRQFLHAAELAFPHPRSGNLLTFTAPLPPDLAMVAAWARAGGRPCEFP
jgi:23S rRNA pseudouridine1911/1915/1917 synthase